MCAAVIVPGRFSATSCQATVPAASFVTWKIATPRAAFVDGPQCGTSLSAFITTMKVSGAGGAAVAWPAAPKAITPAARATTSVFMLTPSMLDLVGVHNRTDRRWLIRSTCRDAPASSLDVANDAVTQMCRKHDAR